MRWRSCCISISVRMRLRSLTSRMMLVTYNSVPRTSGLRLISTGKQLPSLRRPCSSHRDAHRPRARPARVRGAVALVRRAQLVRHEHLHGLVGELGALVAEQRLGLRVDQQDLARPVGDHNGVGEHLDKSPGRSRQSASVNPQENAATMAARRFCAVNT